MVLVSPSEIFWQLTAALNSIITTFFQENNLACSAVVTLCCFMNHFLPLLSCLVFWEEINCVNTQRSCKVDVSNAQSGVLLNLSTHSHEHFYNSYVCNIDIYSVHYFTMPYVYLFCNIFFSRWVVHMKSLKIEETTMKIWADV